MEILYPAGLWAGALACFGIFGAHALRMRADKKYREAWGSATISLFPAAIFWLFVISGEPDMLKRTVLLIPAGALAGACMFAYAGYVIADIKAAKAQTAPGVVVGKNQALVSALESAAAAIAGIGPVAIGVQGMATAGPGSGTSIGVQGVASAGPGGSGTAIGVQGMASTSSAPSGENPRAQALRDAAARVTAGSASKVEISPLLTQLQLPVSIAGRANAALMRAANALDESDLH
jgi:hypothetical protein